MGLRRPGQRVHRQDPALQAAKDPAQARRLDVILALLAETLRRLSILIEAALPATAEKVRVQLQLPAGPRRLEEALFGTSLRGHAIGQPEVLFPPIEPKPAAGA